MNRTVLRRALLLAPLLSLLFLLGACSSKQEKVSTEPTSANPNPTPGMEAARGRSLRVGREGE
ncbi:MAG: hypothetical protein RMJ43_14980 [Chloroherpetonaceae bacterium]|nr:hypothetical protein [Chthonomonadaceae bacterium]MDW8209136.1 hypothetical protein [Chloroherpetonaceae bacterium]